MNLNIHLTNNQGQAFRLQNIRFVNSVGGTTGNLWADDPGGVPLGQYRVDPFECWIQVTTQDDNQQQFHAIQAP